MQVEIVAGLYFNSYVFLFMLSRYVDLLLGEFKHFANKLAHADISKEVIIFCKEMILQC